MGLLSEHEKQFFQDQGYLVKKGLYSETEMEQLKQICFAIWMDQVRAGQIVQDPANPLDSLFPRIANLHRMNHALLTYMMDNRTMGILEELAGEELLVFLQNYYFKAPGGAPIPMHQDNYDSGAYPGTTYAAWISVDASDRENGGLFFVPGTHHFAIYPDESQLKVPRGYQVVEVTTEPGDVVFFGGNIFHGSYPNRSSCRFRQTFLTHYVPVSVEKITINHNRLINRRGETVRRRYNIPKWRMSWIANDLSVDGDGDEITHCGRQTSV